MADGAIDMWAPILPVPEVMAHLGEHFPDAMLGYLRVFWKVPPTQESLRARVGAIAMPLDAIVGLLDAAGIARSLITGFDEESSCGETFIPNALVEAIAGRRPDRFVPFCGIDIGRGTAAIRELRRCVEERGFRGLSLRPFMIGLPADDRAYYPFYAKCCELDVPVSIHASANWTTVAPSDLGHPRHFDRVACDFPELKLVLSHAGYPWVLEACLLAWKHPNVFLELAAHRPRYMAMAGTGWEPLLRFGATTIKEKVLFGTGWFLLGRPPKDVVDEFLALPIPRDVLERWLSANARALLDRAEAAA